MLAPSLPYSCLTLEEEKKVKVAILASPRILTVSSLSQECSKTRLEITLELLMTNRQ